MGNLGGQSEILEIDFMQMIRKQASATKEAFILQSWAFKRTLHTRFQTKAKETITQHTQS